MSIFHHQDLLAPVMSITLNDDTRWLLPPSQTLALRVIKNQALKRKKNRARRNSPKRKRVCRKLLGKAPKRRKLNVPPANPLDAPENVTVYQANPLDAPVKRIVLSPANPLDAPVKRIVLSPVKRRRPRRIPMAPRKLQSASAPSKSSGCPKQLHRSKTLDNLLAQMTVHAQTCRRLSDWA